MKKEYYSTPHYYYKAIDAYTEVKNPQDWFDCPKCGLKPVVWEFDNGRSTACGCGESDYDHHSIHAESIGSVIKRTGGFAEYEEGELQKNWNHYVKTGEELFKHASKRNDGRW